MIDEADVNKKAESRSLAGSRSKSTVTGMRPNTGLELVARQRERAKSDAKVTIEGAESEEEASVDRPRRQTRRSVHDFLFKKLPGQDVDLRDQVQQHVKGIKVHTAFDDSHSMDGLSPRTLVNLKAAQRKPMREVTDAELCAEGSRRKLRVYAAVTLELVKDSYDFDSELLGDGAFGEGSIRFTPPAFSFAAPSLFQFLPWVALVNSLQGEREEKSAGVCLQSGGAKRHGGREWNLR